jgi:integrase
MDRRYLERHGNQWRVRVKVSAKARPVIGKAHLVMPLRTDSLALANRLKHAAVHRLKEQITLAEREADRRTRGGADPIVEEALEWRRDIEAEAAQAPVDEVGIQQTVIASVLYDRAEEIAKSEGDQRAGLFVRVAQSRATPISSLVERWLTDRKTIKPRQKIDYRRAVLKFEKWLSDERLSTAIEDVTRREVGRYVSEVLGAMHWKTGRKDASAVRQYWKWLIVRGMVENTPWTGQSPEKAAPQSPDVRPRPFTDEELRKLFLGITTPLIADAMKIAALSGMRIEEIARLTVQDCDHGAFNIRRAKTTAGVRKVPIHSQLRELIARRTAGKGLQDYLFDELKEPRPGSAVEMGQPITKKFGRARIALGIDDKVPGSRQSRTTFHSFRRTFAHKAEQALLRGALGFNPWTIADVLGHDREGRDLGLAMTMGRYAGPASDDAKRACVEAVRLPDLNSPEEA